MEKQITARFKAHQSCDDLGEGVVKLREEKYKLLLEDANKEIDRQRLTELEDFFAEQTAAVQEYDESLVRRLIESITIYDDHIMVTFKSGIEIDVAA